MSKKGDKMKKMTLALLVAGLLGVTHVASAIVVKTGMMKTLKNTTSQDATVELSIPRKCIEKPTQIIHKSYTVPANGSTKVWYGGGSFGQCHTNTATSMKVTVGKDAVTINNPSGNYTISMKTITPPKGSTKGSMIVAGPQLMVEKS